MTALNEVARFLYKNPGIWSINRVSEATGCGRHAVGRALLEFARVEPKICQRLQPGVYVIRPPEAAPTEETAAPPAVAKPAVTFEEILPDDEDLYPPVKITIYDHFRSKNGDQWFRVKDDVGKRGIFRYINDD